MISLRYRRLKLLAAILSVAAGLSVAYMYYNIAYGICRVPVSYDIGTIDPRFHISEEEARAAVSDAESLWEDATGKNLFSYTKGTAFKVNFVFDERQQKTIEVNSVQTELNQKASRNETIRTEYNTLRVKYDSLKKIYADQVTAYEARLKVHNDQVDAWNKKGGAPEKIYAQIAADKASLDAARIQLNRFADTLNTLVKNINSLGERGSGIITDYNKEVQVFNTKFSGKEEFTQGDYDRARINIYQFKNQRELRLVLTHELGHALGLQHIADTQSVMYRLMEGQLAGFSLSTADLLEFKRVCGTR